MNLSTELIVNTANTNILCAQQRASYLAYNGCKSVIELCVGPSLKILEQAYKKEGIKVYGNDIETKYKKYYPQGNWIIGNCFDIKIPKDVDTIVFAPPLSKGCTGTREDSLPAKLVTPSYMDAINKFTNYNLVLVLPGRTVSVRSDKEYFHKLLHYIFRLNKYPSYYYLYNKVVKYVDIYISK